MKWIVNYSLLDNKGRVVAEIDRILGNEDGYNFRTVIKKDEEEYYDYFEKLKDAKEYLEKCFYHKVQKVIK